LYVPLFRHFEIHILAWDDSDLDILIGQAREVNDPVVDEGSENRDCEAGALDKRPPVELCRQLDQGSVKQKESPDSQFAAVKDQIIRLVGAIE
jgi:hypothetical protein